MSNKVDLVGGIIIICLIIGGVVVIGMLMFDSYIAESCISDADITWENHVVTDVKQYMLL